MADALARLGALDVATVHEAAGPTTEEDGFARLRAGATTFDVLGIPRD